MARNRDETDVEMVAHGTDAKDIRAETIEAVENNAGRKDKAAQLLKAADHAVVVTPEDNKRILRSIDWHILPIVLVIYCLQSLDKTALSYASVFGLVEDLHLKNHEYSWSGAIVYVAQLVWVRESASRRSEACHIEHTMIMASLDWFRPRCLRHLLTCLPA